LLWQKGGTLEQTTIRWSTRDVIQSQGCGSGSWKRLNFCGSESNLKKLEAEANSEATNFIRSWKRQQKIFYCFHIPVLSYLASFSTAIGSDRRWKLAIN